MATLHFLALNVELIVFAQRQASSTRVKVEDRFLPAGHRNEDAHSGNGVLLYVVPGLAISFPVLLSFFVLPPLASKSVYCILLPRLCSTREQKRGYSNSGLRCILAGCFPSSSSWLAETVPGSADVRRVLRTGVLWQLRFGLGYLRGYAVFFWPTHLDEFAYIDAWNYAKAPSSHRGAEGRWRCLRLLVASFGGVHQTLSLGPCAATVQ